MYEFASLIERHADHVETVTLLKDKNVTRQQCLIFDIQNADVVLVQDMYIRVESFTKELPLMPFIAHWQTVVLPAGCTYRCLQLDSLTADVQAVKANQHYSNEFLIYCRGVLGEAYGSKYAIV